jgi:hypothetical protein
MVRRNFCRLALGISCVLAANAGLHAQFQMPDPKTMSGIPRPVDDLPDSAVTVRLIRGQLSNNITGHDVQLLAGGKTITSKTDDAGRAEFKGVAAGTTVKAVTDVDGEHLESQEFAIPAHGGVRLMLVATDKAASAKPAVNGQVQIGGQSRIVMQPTEDSLQIFYLLMVSNSQSAPVNPPTPFVFDVPADATGTTVLEGSSPLASVNGTHVTVSGPFPPGQTFAQVAYELPVSGGSMDVAQRFPAALDELAVVVKKVGDTKLTSPQIKAQQDMSADGETYIAATGPGVPAGQPISLTISGLPHHSALPQWTALTLALTIIVVGAWAATTRRDDEGARAAERKRLVGRREKLLNDLVRVENDQRNGRLDPSRYATRRAELVALLEGVYGALDDDTSVDPAQGPAFAQPTSAHA